MRTKQFHSFMAFMLVLFACVRPADAQTIDTSKMGLNAFVNDGRFGSIREQFIEVKRVLKLKHVRVLFAWNDDVQPSPASEINFSFYDDIVNNLPRRMRALVILTGVPSWMEDPANWQDGNPRKTFAEFWVRKVAGRYRKRRKISGFQIWNEPNSGDSANATLDMQDGPENYVELIALSHNIVKEIAPAKLVVSAATTSINQDYPETLLYNIALKDAGMEQFLDIWGVHYYGENLERFILGGVSGFLNTIERRIWVTESGEQGVLNQLAYAESVWPFLLENVPAITRIYWYQFTEDTPAESTYGLRNLTSGNLVSDLYIHLRDR